MGTVSNKSVDKINIHMFNTSPPPNIMPLMIMSKKYGGGTDGNTVQKI